ncbi:MAG: nuclear transport factor 2 family protein [Pseudomonadota bacterium]
MELYEAQAAVIQLYGQYTDALHRRDAEDWGATWCSDAVWQLPLVDKPGEPLLLEGREAIVGTWSAVMQGFPVVQHVPYAPVVKLDGETITARWTILEHLVSAEGEAHQVLGIYDDTHRVEDGALRYAKRVFNVLSRRPIAAEFETMPHPGKM